MLEHRLEIRLHEFEKTLMARLSEHEAQMSAQLAQFERRLTLRLSGLIVAWIGALGVLIRVLGPA